MKRFPLSLLALAPLFVSAPTWAQLDDTPPSTLPIIGSPAIQNQGIYYMVAFYNTANGVTQNGLYLLKSNDGISWDFASRTPIYVASGAVGTQTRDPRLLYYPQSTTNNKYFVAFTNGTTLLDNGNTFTIIGSPTLQPNDLANPNSWSVVANVDVTTLESPNCTGGLCTSTWGPKWAQNPAQSFPSILIERGNGGTDTNFQTWIINATDGTLANWNVAGGTQIVVGSAPGTPVNQIDGFIQPINGTFYYIFKDETTKYVDYATSSTFAGPYTLVGSGDWAGWGQFLEGMSFTTTNSTTVRFYLNAYVNNVRPVGIYYTESGNWPASGTSATWTALTLISSPGGQVTNPAIGRTQDFNFMRNLLAAAGNQDQFLSTLQLGNLPPQTMPVGGSILAANLGISKLDAMSSSATAAEGFGIYNSNTGTIKEIAEFSCPGTGVATPCFFGTAQPGVNINFAVNGITVATLTPSGLNNQNSIAATAITANATVGTLPANATILYAIARETAGNAVTISLGRTSGATDVASGIALTASTSTMIPISSFAKSWFSNGSTQSIFIDSASWNSASVNITVYYVVGP